MTIPMTRRSLLLLAAATPTAIAAAQAAAARRPGIVIEDYAAPEIRILRADGSGWDRRPRGSLPRPPVAVLARRTNVWVEIEADGARLRLHELDVHINDRVLLAPCPPGASRQTRIAGSMGLGGGDLCVVAP